MTVHDMNDALQKRIDAMPWSTAVNGEPLCTKSEIRAVVEQFFADQRDVNQGDTDHA